MLGGSCTDEPAQTQALLREVRSCTVVVPRVREDGPTPAVCNPLMSPLWGRGRWGEAIGKTWIAVLCACVRARTRRWEAAADWRPG